MKTIHREFQKYLELMEAGEFLETIEAFYDEEMIQIENSNPSIRGKTALLDLEKKNMEGVHSVSVQVQEYVIDEEKGTVIGVMLVRFDSKKSGKKKIEEAFHQKWRGGKITYQRFFYSGFLDDV